MCTFYATRWIYDRRNLQEARQDLAAWLKKWGQRYPKLCQSVEDNIEETLAFYRLQQSHHKHRKSTSRLERLNEELKRRTLVVLVFPNAESCLRLVRALAVEIQENWVEASRYLNMGDLEEHRKEMMRKIGHADRGRAARSSPFFRAGEATPRRPGKPKKVSFPTGVEGLPVRYCDPD